MSRVLPILFNTEMVQAIMDGRKTVTRRVLKLPSYVKKNKDNTYTLFTEGTCYENQSMENIFPYLKAPYQLGDILYIRETWHKYRKRVGKGSCCHITEFYGYKASIANSEDANTPWRPSIHMPKEAARIFLKVKDVRVERLQDITEEQAIKEGCQSGSYESKGVVWGQEDTEEWAATDEFISVWNSTIKKSNIEQYGWNANPWVWVIEFERCEKPEEWDNGKS